MVVWAGVIVIARVHFINEPNTAKAHCVLKYPVNILQKKVNRPPEAKIANRSIKKHQRRLSSGAATRIPYPGLSDALVGATASFIEATVNNSKLSDLSDLMTIKCDVCVLSEYNQVFRLLDGILEADMVNTVT